VRGEGPAARPVCQRGVVRVKMFFKRLASGEVADVEVVSCDGLLRAAVCRHLQSVTEGRAIRNFRVIGRGTNKAQAENYPTDTSFRAAFNGSLIIASVVNV